MQDVVLRDLVKVYGHHVAVRGIDLYIPQGAFTVFVGPSGCGKSTTLRMIAGLETISHGEVRIGGQLVNDAVARARRRHGLPDLRALPAHDDPPEPRVFAQAFGNAQARHRASASPTWRRSSSLLPISTASRPTCPGGQRQRVAMGRAIVREPEVFLFDEPLSNLDAKLRNQMRVEIKRLQRRLKATTVYVTHDQIEAMTLADIIVVMNDGRIAQAGTPMEVFEHPADRFVAGFIGSPQMNFLDGELTGGWRRSGLRRAAASASRSISAASPTTWRRARGLLLGIRPEDIVPEGHGATPRNAVATFGAGVNLTEMLGNETLLFSPFGGRSSSRACSSLVTSSRTRFCSSISTSTACICSTARRASH